MRILPTLLKNAREPQNVNKVPFDEMLPLKLRNFVSGKGGQQSDVACIQEMTILFSCLKNNDFNQTACAKEISTFKGCYKGFMDTKFATKQARAKGGVSTGKKLHARELNVFLRGFPNPK